jgi:hypothetical protein
LELKINLENMILKLSLHGQEIDGVKLHPGKLKEPGYVQQMVNELQRKHAVVLGRTSVEPQFYIDGVQSGMNEKS